MILIFVIGQFVLADAVSGRDRALAQLKAELRPARTLSLEQSARERAEAEVGELRPVAERRPARERSAR